MRIVVMGIGAGLLAVAPVQAQSVDKIVKCSAEPDNVKRLACYDSAVKSLSAEAAKLADAREAAVGAAAAAKAKADADAAVLAARRTEAEFGKQASTEGRLEAIESQIKSSQSDASGRLLFVLENGQVWRQAESRMLPPVRPGMDVTVERASLGSFRMIVPAMKRTIPVARVR